MAFIKDIETTIKTRVTELGRKLLSEGNFNISKFSVGDSYYDYRDGLPTVLDVFDKPFGSRFLLKNSAVEDGLYPIREIKSNPITVTNTAKKRGVFSEDGSNNFSFIESTTYFKQWGTISGVTGDTCIIDQTTRVEVGDFLLVMINTVNNPSLSSTVENYPYTTFKIEGITGSTLGLDRKIENIYSDTSKYWVIPSSFSYYDKNPDKYWDKSSNNINNYCNPIDDVAVWNLNIYYPDTCLGTDTTVLLDNNGYGSNGFSYLLPFLDYDVDKQIGVIHYSNNTIANFYGEGLKDNTATIDLPLVMYHDKENIGIKLMCSTDLNTITDDIEFSADFYDLILEHNSNVVGKCFPRQKLFIIEDEELLSAMTYKSNRNHTLPTPNTFLINTIESEDLLSSTGETLHISYQLVSNKHLNTLPFQKKIKLSEKAIECGGNFNKLQITFNSGDFEFLTNQVDDNSSKFEYNYLRVIFQKTNGDELPLPDKWVYKDFGFSGTAVTENDLITGRFDIVKNDLTGDTFFLDSTAFSLPFLNESDKLNFNDEYLLLGNVNTKIISNVYELTAYLQLDFNSFNLSSNPTWSEDLGYVYISEVNLYDENNNLLAIGSLPLPIIKENDQNRIILLKIDF